MTLADIDPRVPEAITFRFGDCPALCRELLTLVRLGIKTATCTDLRAVKSGFLDMPVVGRQDIALNWDGTPALVIETIDVKIRKFSAVSEAFALSEGESETLEGWRADHEVYFTRNGGFTPDMKLVCERFRMIHDFEA